MRRSDPHRGPHGEPDDSPTPVRRKGRAAGQKRAEMARPGNNNALRHGLYRARQERDRHRRQAVRDWHAVLLELGLTGNRMAKLIAREAAFLLGSRLRMESYLSSRGFFKRDGELRPAVSKTLEVSAGLVDRCARLLEQLKAIERREEPGERVFVCELADGSPAFAPGERAEVPQSALVEDAPCDPGLDALDGPQDEEEMPVEGDATTAARSRPEPPPRPEPPKPPRPPRPSLANELGWVTIAGPGDHPDGW